jgi:hypothetical protein
MDNGWVKIVETSNAIEAKIVADMLNENGILAVDINKRDSSYTVFGRAEVYCKVQDVLQARALIEDMHNENGI